MVAIFAVLFWYIGVGSLYDALPRNQSGVFGSCISYVLWHQHLLHHTTKARFNQKRSKNILWQNPSCTVRWNVISDVTPGRSGYILMPVYLRDQNVPASKALSSVLGIQTIEFLIKVVGGIGAAIFLIQMVPAGNWPTTTILGVNVAFLVIALGIALMLTGALLLAAISWSERAIHIFNRVANSRYLKRFTGGILGKLEEYKDSSQKTRSAIPEILGLTMVCWVLKGFEWFFLAEALGISISSNVAIAWLGFFLIHPLVTALAFVPITPAGAGIQEFGIVGINPALYCAQRSHGWRHLAFAI